MSRAGTAFLRHFLRQFLRQFLRHFLRQFTSLHDAKRRKNCRRIPRGGRQLLPFRDRRVDKLT